MQFGEFRNYAYRKAKYEFKRDTKWVELCPTCNVKITNKNHTIDHIVPLWVIKEYNMPNLEFDKRNFRVMCADCNYLRGTKEISIDTLNLPSAVKDLIISRSCASLEFEKIAMQRDYSP